MPTEREPEVPMFVRVIQIPDRVAVYKAQTLEGLCDKLASAQFHAMQHIDELTKELRAYEERIHSLERDAVYLMECKLKDSVPAIVQKAINEITNPSR
jgi:hypothetical protein